MEEDILDDRIVFSRYRSPCFRKNEINTLIQLVEQYKHILLNKSINANANYAKDRAWDMLTMEFNRQGLGLERSAEVLKTKWENLKRTARKLGKDVVDGDSELNKDDITKTVAMICTENSQSDLNAEKKANDFLNEKEVVPSWPCGDEFSIKSSNDEGKQKTTPLKNNSRAVGFSPSDCKVLLQCVRQEKHVLFGKSTVVKRHRAWKRIAQVYNRQSGHKRTVKELNRKFTAMKAMAKNVNVKGYSMDIKKKKFEELELPTIKTTIKTEPIVECSEDYDRDSDSEDIRSPVNINAATNSNRLSFNDPLNHVHSSDSGLGSTTGTSGNKRPRMELLQYQMETARLHRKYIDDAIKSHELERQMRELEHSLRLRASRLEIIAAECKIPPSHPGLHYTYEERMAQQYLCNT